MTFAVVGAGESIFLDPYPFVYHFVSDPLYGVACSLLLQRVENDAGEWTPQACQLGPGLRSHSLGDAVWARLRSPGPQVTLSSGSQVQMTLR